MKIKLILIFLVSTVLLACSSSKVKATPEQIQTLENLVEGQSFKIESEYAFPLATGSLLALQNSGILAPGDSASRINLLGNSNELRLEGDAISSKLPYFGEIQVPSSYNTREINTIAFQGAINDYEVVKNDDHSYTISFDAKSNGEDFDVTLLLYPNLKSEMILKGAKRFPIRYTGYVANIPIQE